MYRMYGMPRAQGSAGAAHVQDVRAEKCSCIFCTSAIHGGRMPRAQGTENVPDISSIPSIPGGQAQERRMYRMYGMLQL